VELVPGRRPALESVRAGAAREILIAEEARATPGLRELVEAAGAAGVPLRRVPAAAIDDLAGEGVHQGVLARVAFPKPIGEADLAARDWREDAVLVLLDGVTDPRNVGALARTAEAAGAAGLVLRERRGAGLSPAALRASAGALLHLPVAAVANLPRMIRRLQDGGFWIVGLHGDAATTLDQVRPPRGRLALVVGAEGEGLSRLVRQTCDELVRIPMGGHVASLNVSVAAGIALFRLRPPGKQRHEAGKG
jgi:23S rRNA (guanosine2251-2'-O)-methyltransferase